MRAYLAVLQTFRCRPLFGWAALACLLWHALAWSDRAQWDVGLHERWDLDSVVTDLAGSALRVCVPVALGVAWSAHVRELLAGEHRVLVPGYVGPHQRVARVMLPCLALFVPLLWWLGECSKLAGMGWTWWNAYYFFTARWSWYGGALIVSTTLAVVSALSATYGSAWVSLLLVPIALIARLASGLDPWDWYGFVWQRYQGADHRMVATLSPSTVASAVGPLVLVAVTRAVLWRRLNAMVEVAENGPDEQARPVGELTLVAVRAPLKTTWARVRHRRSLVLSGWAPWVVGGLVAVVLNVFPPSLYDWHHPETQLRISLILVTVLPAVAVGCIWAERWPRVAAESLLPATRGQFVAETAAAVGIDLATFWVAIAIGVTVPLLVFPAVPTDNWSLAIRLGASAAVQAVAFAAVLWGLIARSWPALAVMLGVALVAMAGPMLMGSKREPMVPVSALLPTSAVIVVIGCVCVAAAWRRLGRCNLA